MTNKMATHRAYDVDSMLQTDLSLDNLELLGSKMDALIAVAESGQNFAVRIPFSNVAPKQPDPRAENTARENMTPMEIRQYDAWTNGAIMPSIDWPRSRQATHTSETQLMSHSAVVMQRIWKNDALSAEHACWVSQNRAYTLPLISAATKINAAQCDLFVRQQGRNAAELDPAWVQGMLKIVVVAKGDLMRCEANAKVLKKSIHPPCETLRARKNALKAKMMGCNQGDDPINKKCVTAGLKPIGADIDWSGCTTGSRDGTSGVPPASVATRIRRTHKEGLFVRKIIRGFEKANHGGYGRSGGWMGSSERASRHATARPYNPILVCLLAQDLSPSKHIRTDFLLVRPSWYKPWASYSNFMVSINRLMALARISLPSLALTTKPGAGGRTKNPGRNFPILLGPRPPNGKPFRHPCSPPSVGARHCSPKAGICA